MLKSSNALLITVTGDRIIRTIPVASCVVRQNLGSVLEEFVLLFMVRRGLRLGELMCCIMSYSETKDSLCRCNTYRVNFKFSLTFTYTP